MLILLDINEKRLCRSLYDDHDGDLPDFTGGEHVPLEIALVRRVSRPWDSRIYTPIDPTDWTVTAALGGTRKAVGGTCSFSYDDDDGLIEVPLKDPTAFDIENAMNSIPAVESAGGVVVSGEDGFFVVEFNEDGAREIFEANASQSVPLMTLEFVRVVTGDGSTREVQSIKIEQSVASLVELTEDSADPVATVEVLVVGTGSTNAEVRITLPENRWGGTWFATVAGNQSDLIGWDDSEEQVQTIFEAITGVGVGNVSVRQDGDDSFMVLFRGTLIHTAITVTADGSALKVIQTKNGVLDLSVSQVQFLLNGSESSPAAFEIETTPPSGDPSKTQIDSLISRPVIGSGWTVSQPIPRTFFLTGLDGFVGGGSTKVDGAAHTVGKAIGSIFRGVVLGTLYEWELQAGTAVSNPSGIIRPTDYNASTNPRNLVQVGG